MNKIALVAGAGLGVGAYLTFRLKSTPEGTQKPTVETVNSALRGLVGDKPIDAAEQATTSLFCKLFGGCEIADYTWVYTDPFGMAYEVTFDQGNQLVMQTGGLLKQVLKSDLKQYVN